MAEALGIMLGLCLLAWVMVIGPALAIWAWLQVRRLRERIASLEARQEKLSHYLSRIAAPEAAPAPPQPK